MRFDVCIIGGGAAGLMASIFAAQQNAKTAVVEKNASITRKLLKTGGGRCNLTHAGSIDDLVREYDFCGRFLKHSLYTFSPEAVQKFFAERGLATKTDKDGCVFPITDRAADVSRVLFDTARRAGVSFIHARAIERIEKQYSGDFVLRTGAGDYESSTVIIATGGVSWPFTGSTGDGYDFAKTFGHTIVEPKSAMAPLISVESWPTKLQGVAVPDVRISSTIDDKKIHAQGALMFTDDGIGGPVGFDLSRSITDYLHHEKQPLPVKLDFCPNRDFQQLEDFILTGCSNYPRQEIARVITDLLPRALTLHLVERIQPEGRPVLAAQLPKESRRELIHLIKEMPLTIKSVRPIAEATVTRGGVALDEIDPTTMQSKLCEGLFFAGEVINADGPCGGYNLQIAWSTGALAGKTAATRCQTK